MKYTFDLVSNAYFMQISGSTETDSGGETPFGFQLRQDSALLSALKSATEEVLVKIKQVDEDYHDVAQARNDFEYGFSLFRPGDTPICYVVQRRRAYLSVGGRSVGNQPLSLDNFLHALDAAIKGS